MSFSEQLKRLLILNNMKAADLARATGLSEAAISDYLKGKKEPRGKQSIAIAKALNVSLDVLWETGFQNDTQNTKKSTTVSDDELWKALNIDPSKEALVHWIMKLDQDDREKFMKAISMYSQLDAYDRGGIIERMAILLEQDKYAIRKTSSNGKAV